MNTLIDGRCYQAALQTGNVPEFEREHHIESRINQFLEIVEEVTGASPEIDTSPLTEGRLSDVHQLIILSRSPGGKFSYTEEEYRGINEHLRQGGALLLMTNHPPFAMHDRKLMDNIEGEHGVSVYGYNGYEGGDAIEKAEIYEHPITKDVDVLLFRNSHRLEYSSEHAQVLATIPSLQAGTDGFAIAFEDNGRIVFGADSGFICDESSEPDTGYIDRADNRRFTRQMIEWLVRKR